MTLQDIQNQALKLWQSQANFFYLQLKNTTSDNSEAQLAQITNSLKEQGTLIRHTGGGLRITIGIKEENTRTLERLANIL